MKKENKPVDDLKCVRSEKVYFGRVDTMMTQNTVPICQYFFGFLDGGHLVGYSRNYKTICQRIRNKGDKREPLKLKEFLDTARDIFNLDKVDKLSDLPSDMLAEMNKHYRIKK